MNHKNAILRHGKSSAGFTLIEILTALAILAIVLPVAMSGIGLAARLAGLTRQRSIASTLAERKLNELVVTGSWNNGATGGDFSGNPGYSWQAATQTCSEPDLPNADLTELDVTVTWRSTGRQHEITMSTLVYPSPPSASAGTTSGGTQ